MNRAAICRTVKGAFWALIMSICLLLGLSTGYCAPYDANLVDLEFSQIGSMAPPEWFSTPGFSGASATVTSELVNPAFQRRELVLPGNVALPVRVGVSLIVNKLYQINEPAGTFTADIDLHYYWRDPRQAFNKAAAGMDRLEYNGVEATKKLAAIWTPGLQITNMAGKPQKEQHGLWIFADGTVRHVYRLTAVFENRYNLKAFPFDNQALSIILAAPQYSITNVELVSNQVDLNQSGIRQDCVYQGWNLTDVSFKSSQNRGWNGSIGSELVAQINVKRDFAGHIFVIFLPMLVLITLPILYLQDHSISYSQRLGALSGNMLAFITLYFTISLRYPVLDIGSSVLQMFRIGFAYFFGLLLLVAVIYNQAIGERFFGKDLLIETKQVLRWGVPLLIYSLLLYTLLSSINS